MIKIVKRGERKWLVRVFLGRDPETGKQKMHSKTINGTKKDAETYVHGILRDRDLGKWVQPSKMTVNALADRWLEESVRPFRAERTYQGYKGLLAWYVRPAVGSVPVSDLSTPQLQKLYNDLTREGKAAATVRQVHAVVRKMLGQAIKWGLLAQNVSLNADLPSLERKKMTVLTSEQSARFLAAARDHEYAVLWELLLISGARIGEILALTWGDVDLKAGCITIAGTLTAFEDGTRRRTRPKTDAGFRDIPLTLELVAALKSHRAAQREALLAAGAGLPQVDFLFTREDGGPLSRDQVRHRFLRLMAKAGLPRIRLHDVRHTVASILLAHGTPIPEVQERLGHATPAVTMAIYSHALPGRQKDVTDTLAVLFYNRRSKAQRK